MKILIYLLLIVFSIKASAQKIIKVEKVTDKSIHVFGDDFEGVIFTKKYDVRWGVAKSNGKNFTPTENDIVLVEKLVKKGLDTIKSLGNHNLIVKRRLKHYWRQYFGYINDRGERIITINGLWKDPEFIPYNHWLKDIVVIEDGGDNYWQVKINVDKLELFDFAVNGVA